jgi:hypothetical protein
VPFVAGNVVVELRLLAEFGLVELSHNQLTSFHGVEMDPLDWQLLGFQQASVKLVHLSYRPSRSFSVVVVVGAYKQPFAVVAYAWPQPLPPVAVVVVLVVF